MYNTDEVLKRLNNFRCSTIDGERSKLIVTVVGEGIKIEVRNILGEQWTHSGLQFSETSQFEEFLKGYDKVRGER